MNTKIFRKVSLARLASPEQLDQLLVVTSPKSWFALLALFLLLGVAVLWGYTGSLPTKATGQGIIVRTGGVSNIVSMGAGMLISLDLKVGDHVRANQVVAQVAQPAQLEKIKATREALEEARQLRLRSMTVRRKSAELESTSIQRQAADINRQISEMTDQSKVVAERIPVAEQLLTKGLVTKQTVLDARQKLVDVQGQISTLRTQLTQLEARRFSSESAPMQTDADTQGRISDLERTLAGYEKELTLTTNVVSPYDGEVIELKAYPGATIGAGAPLVSIQPRTNNLELLVYLPANQAKDASAGMDVQVSPTTVRREEYGFIKGKVTYVSDYPATSAALMRNFQNEALVGSLTNSGPVTEVRVTMIANPSTPSGFQWSSPTGPPVTITSGSLCNVEIVTREQKPITLLFPYMKRTLGLA